jgi:excisionase family DNA binding protein
MEQLTRGNARMLTLVQAAKETGLTKPAIFKAIKKGKISASKDARGQWLIDPAELFRGVYPGRQEAGVTQRR